MKKIYNKIKRKFSNKRQLFISLIPVLLFIFFITYMGNALVKQPTLYPENPIDEMDNNNSWMTLAEKNDSLGDISEENEEASDNLKEDKEDIEEDDEDDEENSDIEGEMNLDDDKNLGENENSSDNLQNPESPNIELVDPEDKDKINDGPPINNYFITSIVQDEIVTTKEYSFAIMHLNQKLEVKNTSVSLNNQLVEDFRGKITLKEGPNSIKISVLYKDTENKLFIVSKNYTVNYNPEDIVIYTSLKENMNVKKPELTFTASAKKGDDDLPVEVKLNENKIAEKQTNHYSANLKEGKNKITIIAKDDIGNNLKEDYIIKYEPENTEIKFITDLPKEKSVERKKFKFNAIGMYGDKKIKIRVTQNANTVEPIDDEGNYSLDLVDGSNNIVLRAKHGDDYLEEEYKIQYNKYLDPEEAEKPGPNDPVVETNLKDGITVKTNKHNIWVRGKDSKGNRIEIKDLRFTVICNGEFVGVNWADNDQISYILPIVNGENEISIRVRDNEYRDSIKRFKVNGIVKEDGEVSGKATISVEATTLGLGYLIPPTEVDIHQGEPASYVLDRVLKENGFTYKNTGTLDDSFYLAEIGKKGMVKNPTIPEDLDKKMKESTFEYRPNDYHSDLLGEFDLSSGSGWMVSVDGHYNNYGFADTYLVDGQTIRIRFTLALGMDIGGAGSLGGDGSNWEKEW